MGMCFGKPPGMGGGGLGGPMGGGGLGGGMLGGMMGGRPQYGQPGYGQPQYGQQGYGQPPYGQQGARCLPCSHTEDCTVRRFCFVVLAFVFGRPTTNTKVRGMACPEPHKVPVFASVGQQPGFGKPQYGLRKSLCPSCKGCLLAYSPQPAGG